MSIEPNPLGPEPSAPKLVDLITPTSSPSPLTVITGSEPAIPVGEVGQIAILAGGQRNWVGPLPSPESLAKFKEIDPDIPRAIVKMAQMEQKLQVKRLNAQIRDAKALRHIERRGQDFAFTLALVFLITGVVMTVAGYETFGITVVGTTLVSITIAMLSRGKKTGPPKVKGEDDGESV